MTTGRCLCLLLLVTYSVLLQQPSDAASSSGNWETDDVWGEDGSLMGDLGLQWEKGDAGQDEMRGAMPTQELQLMLERLLAPAVGVGDVSEAVRKLTYGAQSRHVMRNMASKLETWLEMLQSPSADFDPKKINQLFSILQLINSVHKNLESTAEE